MFLAEKLLFYDKVISDDGWRLLMECLNQENALEKLELHEVFPAIYEKRLELHDVFPARYEKCLHLTYILHQLARGLSSRHCNLTVLKIHDEKLRKFRLNTGLKDHFLGAVATNPLQVLCLDSLLHHVFYDRPESPVLPTSFKWNCMEVLSLINMQLGLPSMQLICKNAKALVLLNLSQNFICLQCIEELAQYVIQDGNKLESLNISSPRRYRYTRLYLENYTPILDALVAGQCKLKTLNISNTEICCSVRGTPPSHYTVLNKFVDSMCMENFKVQEIIGMLSFIPTYAAPDALKQLHDLLSELDPTYVVPNEALHRKLSEHRLQRPAYWPVTYLGEFPVMIGPIQLSKDKKEDRFYGYLQKCRKEFLHVSKHMILIAEGHAGLRDVFENFLKQFTLEKFMHTFYRKLLSGHANRPVYWSIPM